MNPNTAITHIRQLCNLGIGSEAIMPAVLRAVHEVVSSDSNAFFWVSPQFDITNVCAERLLPLDAMRKYYAEFYDAPEFSFKRELSRRARGRDDVDIPKLDAAFYASRYYRDIWKALDAHHVMYAVVRHGGVCYGQLSLYRSQRSRPFMEADRRKLARVLPYLQVALTVPKAASEALPYDPYLDSESSGLLVMDEDGQVISSSAEAHRLLFLATNAQISPHSVVHAPSENFSPLLKRLRQELLHAERTGSDERPMQHVRNHWGMFACRAYRLPQSETQGQALIGVTIQHREPFRVRLLNRMKDSSLSVRQKDVVLLLARGFPYSEIARQLDISVNTANYHIRQIYNRLGAHDRNDAIRKLLGET